MGKKHKNKVRVLPGRMYRLVRSDRSVYLNPIHEEVSRPGVGRLILF